MTLGKVVATLVVIVLAIPGLIIEPGPLSEIVAGGLILGIWGFDDESEQVTT
jgi:hypothetical protein